MKTTSKLLSGLIIILLLGCSSKSNENKQINVDSTSTTSTNTNENPPSISKEFLGVYEGDQDAYNLKNQFGDDMIISGKKVKVPGSIYKVVFKENNLLSIQQTSKEDDSRYYYDGTYSIIKDDNNYYELECKVTDGKTSKLTYNMTMNKKDFSIHCVGHNEPDFDLTKNDLKNKENKEVKFEGILGTETMYGGEWSIEIKVTAGALKGQELTAYISTCGLGMTDKYAIERKGNVDLNGADEYFGRKVKGVLLESHGEFANLSESDDRIFKKVWRIKELDFK